MQISIEHELNQAVAKYEKVLTRSEINKGIAKAINRTLAGLKTVAKREVAKRYKISQKDVASTLKTYNARTDGSEPNGLFMARSPRFHLNAFNPIQDNRGVTVTVKGDSKLIAHAFVTRMSNGHIGVFTRHKTEMMQSKPKRQKIEELDSLSVAYAITADGVDEKMAEELKKRLENALEQQLSYILTQVSK